MKNLLILLVLLSIPNFLFSQTLKDTVFYKELRQKGITLMKDSNYMEALNKFIAANRFAQGIKKPDIDKLILEAQDSIRNTIKQLKIEKTKTEIARSTADSFLRIANKIVSASYFYAGKFGLAYKNSKFGFIDKNGNVVIDYKYTSIEPFNEYTGLAKGLHENRYPLRNEFFLIDTMQHEYKLSNYYNELDSNTRAIEFNDISINWNKIFKCNNIEILKLNYYHLTSIPKDIAKLQNLKYFDLNYNNIQSLPIEMNSLGQLRWLGLNGNKMEKLQPELCNLPNLSKLDLEYNQLTEIPKEIGQLKELSWLNAAYNRLTELPTEMGELTKLRVLILNNNHLKSLPTSFSNLQSLKILYINNNDFDTLPEVIASLKQLNYLRFPYNVRVVIPDKILNIPQLDLYSSDIDSCVKYKNYDLAKKIRIAILNKKLNVTQNLCWSVSWSCLFAYDFDGAINAGKQYIKLGGDSISAISNLALGYLWSGQYQKAHHIYSKYKEQKDLRGRRGKEIFLKDIEDVLYAKVDPIRVEDVISIKAFLRDQE